MWMWDQVTYDPSKVSFGQLLEVFFSVAHQSHAESIFRGRTRARSTARSSSTPATSKKIANAYIAGLDQAKIFKHKK